MIVEKNKNYNFVVKNLSFGDLSYEEVCEAYRDGRLGSFMLEKQIPKWFPQLEWRKDKKGYDHIDTTTGQRYEQKSFTKNGLDFSPSYQKGSGRKANLAETREIASKLVYICCDITRFPKVSLIFKDGSDMIKMFPKAKVTKTKKHLLFDE